MTAGNSSGTGILAALKNRGAVPVLELVHALLEEAHTMRASDIHLTPQPDGLIARYRIDGALRDAHRAPRELHEAVISRIKVLAGLRTDEHQSAQDGRFRVTLNARSVDVRVSIAPTYHGENAVMRLLADRSRDFTLQNLGFSADNVLLIQSAMRKPHGLILATGPTGSGKTTTLYTLLQSLNTPDISIITIEDPIEYAIERISQIQVNARAGLTFASGLRSMVRQDPNVIMVGEIRDAETAGIAVNTALTGHLVLSTMHTADACSAVPRMLDLNIQDFLIASTVSLVIGQRLVRKICEECRIKKPLSPSLRASICAAADNALANELQYLYCGAGCAACRGTGYCGRIGVHEVLKPDDELREAVLRHAPSRDLKKLALARGMTGMLHDGLAKARDGVTSIDEILRMTYD